MFQWCHRISILAYAHGRVGTVRDSHGRYQGHKKTAMQSDCKAVFLDETMNNDPKLEFKIR